MRLPKGTRSHGSDENILYVMFNVGALTASYGSDVGKSEKDSRKGNFCDSYDACR
jgi:hypothetical protein